jgi:hypothetical protein
MNLKTRIVSLNLLCVFIFSGFCRSASCQISSQQGKKEAFELFGSNDLLNISVTFDLATFLRKNLKGKPLDGILTLRTGKNDSIIKEVFVNTRGIFRLQYCGFPPMELEFKKPFYAYQYRGTIKKLKLVTQCQSSDIFQDYVLKEYLCYRIYSLFTDTSFRVRLVKATYIDSRRSRKPVQQFGFFIEPQSLLAVRENSRVLKNVEITQRNIDQEVMTRVAIFSYMIGDYDWAVPNQHNITILQPKDSTGFALPLAVPHDFDWTGIVNPIYAIPADNVGLETVRERLFLGVCLSREKFRIELLKFIPYKQKIYKLINDFPYLSPRARKEMTDYLDEFFQQVENQGRLNLLIDKMMTTCKPI